MSLQDQQFGASLGTPIQRGRMWFFGSYKGELNLGTVVSTPPGGFSRYTTANNLKVNEDDSRQRLHLDQPGQSFRRHHQPEPTLRCDEGELGMMGSWSSTHGADLVNELKIGYNDFEWTNAPYVNSIIYIFPTTQIGGLSNYPQDFIQHIQQYRDDVFWLRGKHSIKTGLEHLFNHHLGVYDQSLRGQISCNGDPTASTLYPGSTFPSVFPKSLRSYDVEHQCAQ